MDLLNKIFKPLENDMKAILKFNLPEEADDFKLATQSSDMYSVLWELDQWLRKKIRYSEDMSEDTYTAYEDCRKQLYELMENSNIKLEL
jgi:hypothetical protein